MVEKKDTTWEELLNDFNRGIGNVIEKLQEHNIETIPGAIEALLNRLKNFQNFFTQNDGELFVITIEDKIQNSFFPNTPNFTEAFEKILNSRTHEQDFIINELLNGFVASKSKAIASGTDIPIIDRLVEAFSKRNDFKIVDHQFYAMFGDPNKPRSYVKKNLEKIVDLFGLEAREKELEDVRTGKKKKYTFYSFPEGVIEILNEKYLIQVEELDYTYISEDFDRNIFICMFLANISINRGNLDKLGGSLTINGISNIFALILLLSIMPKVNVEDNNPILRNTDFNHENMNIIPKSWMNKNILKDLILPITKIVAYRLGGGLWASHIKMGEKESDIALQAMFLLKDVNKWILGNMVRVQIPIFVEIANIFAEITIGRGE